MGVNASPMPPTNSVKAILFDLDGTLRHTCPSGTKTFLDFAVQLGVTDAVEKRLKAARWSHYYWAQSPELLKDLQDFPEEEGFWLNYAQRHLMAFDCTPQSARDLAPKIHRYMREQYEPGDCVPADVPHTLQQLKSAGYRLAVLSNRTEPCQEQLEELGLDIFFEFSLVAGEVEVWKPDPQIFHHALERLGTRTGDTLYIGDNYFADVLGAQAAGLRPILVDPEGLFPDAGCPVIRSMSELLDILHDTLVAQQC